MVKEVHLSVENISSELLLEISNNDWCQVFYINNNGDKVSLGADCYDIIKTKIMMALKKDKNKHLFTYKEMEMFYILALSEKHATINGYFTKDGKIKIIIIEDGGKVLPTILLGREDIAMWIKKLD